MKRYNMIAFGNTLVDHTYEISDDFLVQYGLKKGQWIQPNVKIRDLEWELSNPIRSAGGSAANVAAGCANLGGQSLFFGSIGTDDVGKFYESEMRNCGVYLDLRRHDGPNGKCISMITPDKERTFKVNMGMSSSLKKDEVPNGAFFDAELFHTSAFMLDSCSEALERSLESAYIKCVITFDLASKQNVKTHKENIERIIGRYVDVVFANEEEAEELTGEKPEKAALAITGEYPCVAVVKAGKDGAFVAEDEKLIHIPAFPTKVIDTNGAGDAFAAGFNFVYSRSKNAEAAAYLGAHYASRVVAVNGARL
jgi:sugar/nucleoside kinase (ribokinase family)